MEFEKIRDSGEVFSQLVQIQCKFIPRIFWHLRIAQNFSKHHSRGKVM